MIKCPHPLKKAAPAPRSPHLCPTSLGERGGPAAAESQGPACRGLPSEAGECPGLPGARRRAAVPHCTARASMRSPWACSSKRASASGPSRLSRKFTAPGLPEFTQSVRETRAASETPRPLLHGSRGAQKARASGPRAPPSRPPQTAGRGGEGYTGAAMAVSARPGCRPEPLPVRHGSGSSKAPSQGPTAGSLHRLLTMEQHSRTAHLGSSTRLWEPRLQRTCGGASTEALPASPRGRAAGASSTAGACQAAFLT